MPIDSAAWFAETISSVLGSTTISGTCIVLSRFCFSPSARAARSASRSALRRFTSKPASRMTSTTPSSATAPLGNDGATLGKNASSHARSET